MNAVSQVGYSFGDRFYVMGAFLYMHWRSYQVADSAQYLHIKLIKVAVTLIEKYHQIVNIKFIERRPAVCRFDGFEMQFLPWRVVRNFNFSYRYFWFI